MLGFKTFRTARIVLGGIELVHMLRKGQLAYAPMSAVEAFYSLVAQVLDAVGRGLTLPFGR